MRNLIKSLGILAIVCITLGMFFKPLLIIACFAFAIMVIVMIIDL